MRPVRCRDCGHVVHVGFRCLAYVFDEDDSLAGTCDCEGDG